MSVNAILELMKDKKGRIRPKFSDIYHQLRRFSYTDEELSIIEKNVEEVINSEEARKALKKLKRKERIVPLVK